MATMHVEVVSAEKSLLSTEATEVYARSLEEGEIGILPGHQPCLLALEIAPVKIVEADGTIERVAVHHGFLFFRNNELVVLADQAEVAAEIDVERARARRSELASRSSDDKDAQRRLRKAELRLDVAEE